MKDRQRPVTPARTALAITTRNLWPVNDAAPGFQAAFTAYYFEVERLAIEVVRIFAPSLGLEEMFFDDKIDKGASNFVACRYPSLSGRPLHQLRGGAHTDLGSLSILRRETLDGGPGGVRRREWHDVPTITAHLTPINIGDLMEQWSNGRWVLTFTGMINPRSMASNESRYSIALF